LTVTAERIIFGNFEALFEGIDFMRFGKTDPHAVVAKVNGKPLRASELAHIYGDWRRAVRRANTCVLTGKPNPLFAEA
jgi:hypothetical protein